MPPETDAPLIVDADAVLPSPMTGEFLQAVAWRTAEIRQGLGGVHDEQFAEGGSLQLKGPSAHPLTFEDLLGDLVPEAFDHPLY